MKLYDLSKEFEALYELANEADGDELIELFNELHDKLSDKLENSGKVIRQLQSDSEALKAESDRLTARRKTVDVNIERLKDMMLEAMKSSGEAKLKTTLFNFSVRSDKSVLVTDQLALTKEFIRTKTTIEPDKKAIKEALENGVIVAGAEIIINESMQIK